MLKLFKPQSVAIIGASRHKEKIGYQILDNLIKSGYKGKIYPVNPEASEILGLKSFKHISEINDVIDLALVVVPAIIVQQELQNCVLKQIPYAIVISSGFSEIGPNGKRLQEQIKNDIVKNSHLRVVGPNCLGLINTSNGLNLTFAAPKMVTGNVSAVFQSGALGVAFLDLAQKYEFGFAKFVSLGNKVDLEESEILNYLADDPDTAVIALYIEEISNPAKFFRIARETSYKKPIVVLKGGITKLGAKAAFSHTASMVGSKEINRAIFSQANLINVKTIEEMLSIISILSHEPPVQERKLAIITNAGGPGIIATDAASRHQFTLPSPKKNNLKKELKMASLSSIANPLDLTGAAKANDYEIALSYFSKDDSFSSILILLTPQTATEIKETANVIAKYAKSPKPIISSFLGDKMVENATEILKKAQSPHFEDPDEGIRALEKVITYWQKRFSNKTPLKIKTLEKISRATKDPLALISDYHISVPKSGMALNIISALQIFREINGPVAVKNISPRIIHKFKSGKVKLNIQNENDLKRAISNVGFPILIQKMIDIPLEVIVGAKRDENIGVLITFGWGGIFTQDILDFSTKITPLTENDLNEMIKETKIGKILIRENINLDKLKDTIIAVTQIMTDYPEIAEIDLNPIKIDKERLYCVDARYK